MVNLNWNARPAGGGGFKALFGGGNGAIDLDLGCLYELQDGSKGVVQALGDSFGSYYREPYIELDGDDRTGASAAGEALCINGEQWQHMKRVLIYAFIYAGVPSWSTADGVVTIKVPHQSEIEVRMDSHSNRDGMCAIAMLENHSSNIKVTKQLRYFQGHKIHGPALWMGYALGRRLKGLAKKGPVHP